MGKTTHNVSSHELKKTEALSDFPELIQKLLLNRGITSRDAAERFLHPDYATHTHDPFLMKDVEKAAGRVIDAVLNEESVVVYSDYDTDGIPGAVILNDLFQQLGHDNFSVYIPHRNKEGFGVHKAAIDSFKNADLLITVDCGITASESVEHANQYDIDVIVTDHHLPDDTLPPAYAIVNPKQEECNYPEKDLCGAAVAFKLAKAVVERARDRDIDFAESTPEGWEKWMLDMVGIATVSDMVPLRGENRVLARYGLTVLRKSRRPGLKKLLKKARVYQANITESDIGYGIGPRINAASRMDVPMDAFKLLATQDISEATQLADHLHSINNKRKGIVSALVKKARKKLSKRTDLGPIVVTGNPEWKPSLLGLACNTLVDEFERPVFLWGRQGDEALKGSCRSDGSVNVVDLMSAVPEEVFLTYGGHAHSGGYTVATEHIHSLETYLTDAYHTLEKTAVDTEVVIDATLSLDEVSWNTYDKIKQLAPFGEGNPQPVFLFKDIEIQAVETFGKQDNHLKLQFKNRFGAVEAIAFFAKQGDYTKLPETGKKVDLIAHMEKSTFRGKAELRLRIVDIR